MRDTEDGAPPAAPNSSTTSSTIEQSLRKNFTPSVLLVEDESALHANHSEAKKSGGGHYRVVIVDKAFVGKRPLERHRLIYEALQTGTQLQAAGIHALSIHAFTPQEWQEKSH